MNYDTVAMVSQVTSLLLFIFLFIVVIGYALWPENREKFERAARSAIDSDTSNKTPGART